MLARNDVVKKILEDTKILRFSPKKYNIHRIGKRIQAIDLKAIGSEGYQVIE